jgi:hypothetical protein
MTDETRTVGHILYDAAQDMVDHSEALNVRGGVVIKAAFIADVMAPDGTRALVDLYVTDGGDLHATHWDAKGMLHDALSQYDWLRGRSGESHT